MSLKTDLPMQTPLLTRLREWIAMFRATAGEIFPGATQDSARVPHVRDDYGKLVPTATRTYWLASRAACEALGFPGWLPCTSEQSAIYRPQLRAGNAVPCAAAPFRRGCVYVKTNR